MASGGIPFLFYSIYNFNILIGESIHRGQVIGSKILDLLLFRFRRETDIGAISLVTSIENKSAINTFERAGFQKKMPI
jgi:RimJ/RimL family protein N-acetyltransferase